jgi:hypothetical protein
VQVAAAIKKLPYVHKASDAIIIATVHSQVSHPMRIQLLACGHIPPSSCSINACCPALYCCLQPDINEKMRAILIDWLVEVHLKFKVTLVASGEECNHSNEVKQAMLSHQQFCTVLQFCKQLLCAPAYHAPCTDFLSRHFALQLMPESLFLTINLIDRYLAARQVTRKNLQLVSTSFIVTLPLSKKQRLFSGSTYAGVKRQLAVTLQLLMCSDATVVAVHNRNLVQLPYQLAAIVGMYCCPGGRDGDAGGSQV